MSIIENVMENLEEQIDHSRTLRELTKKLKPIHKIAAEMIESLREECETDEEFCQMVCRDGVHYCNKRFNQEEPNVK